LADFDRYLDEIAAGDAEAFARWVAGAEPRVRLSLSSYAVAVDVEAVVQETLLRIWQVAHRVEPDGRANCLLRLAVRIARNLAVDHTRRLRTTPLAPPDLQGLLTALAEPSTLQPPTPDPHLRATIDDCRERLPKKPRQALTLRLTHGGRRSDHDLAADAQMRLNTFLQNVGRARRLMADCLERHGVNLTEVLR